MESFAAIEKINSTKPLSIENFEDGSIKLSDIMEEVNYLKEQIPLIRHEMASFLTGLAMISSSQKAAQQVFDESVAKVTNLQKNLDDYVERYKKLTPLLVLVQRDLNLKAPEKQQPSPKAPSQQAASNSSAPAKKQAPKKRAYNKKPQSQGGNNNNLSQGDMGTITGFHREANGSENQPIVL